MNDRFSDVIDEVDLLILEARRLRAIGPNFVLVQRSPGEDPILLLLIHRSREFIVRLTPGLILLFDYLSKTRWLPQTATQIATGMAASAARGKRKRSPSRFSVKTFVNRIRVALGTAFCEAAADLDPRDVLVSEAVGNQVHYRLRARIEWQHMGVTHAKPQV
jgi:hypothetical protein